MYSYVFLQYTFLKIIIKIFSPSIPLHPPFLSTLLFSPPSIPLHPPLLTTLIPLHPPLLTTLIPLHPPLLTTPATEAMQCQIIDMDELSKSESEQLFKQALVPAKEKLHKDVVSLVQAKTSGLPVAITSTVQFMRQDKTLENVNGTWTFASPAATRGVRARKCVLGG